MPSYQILRLDDAKMSIKAHLKIGRGSTWNIIKHRSKFLSLIWLNTFNIVVYNYWAGGSTPTVVYVLNIETENTIDTDNVKEKITQAIWLSPIHASPQMTKDITAAIYHS